MRYVSRFGRMYNIKVFIILLLISAAFFAWMAISGCFFCEDDEPQKTDDSVFAKLIELIMDDRKAKLLGSTSQKQPGERMTRQLLTQGGDADKPLQIKWSPPPGATGFRFTVEPEPGGPPFVWNDVTGTGEVALITYEAPDLAQGEAERYCIETATSITDDGFHHTAALGYTVKPAGEGVKGSSSTVGLTVGGGGPVQGKPSEQAGTVAVWRLQRWIDFPGKTLTSELCRDWVEWLAGDDAFFAVRMPVAASAVPTESVSLPFFADAEHPASLAFIRFSGLAVQYAADLEMREERMTFAANVLPQAEDEMWITLGVSPDSPAVPDGIAVGADGWGIKSELYVDLSAQPDDGEGLIQPIYYCYDGEERPHLSRHLQRLAVALGYRREGGLQVVTYLEWCITCMGPQTMAMVDEEADWALTGGHSAFVDAGDVMRFRHTLVGGQEGATAVTFAISSTLDMPWQVYEGDYEQPNMGKPITGAYTVWGGDMVDIWLVSNAVPEGAADGPYSVGLTAEETGGGETRWTSSVFWVGEWVAPQPTATSRSTATPTAEPMHPLCVPLILAGR